jgi:hypothetical protein
VLSLRLRGRHPSKTRVNAADSRDGECIDQRVCRLRDDSRSCFTADEQPFPGRLARPPPPSSRFAAAPTGRAQFG